MECHWKERLIGASKVTAMASMIMWFISLFLNGFMLYGGTQYAGWKILSEGWQSLLIWNFAWLANVFLLIALFMRWGRPKIAEKCAVFAVILAFDTFRFSGVYTHLGSSQYPIYGYGIGFVIWFVAILLMFISVSMNKLASSERRERQIGFFGSAVSSLSLCIFIALVVFYAVDDRLNANKYEAEFMASNSVVFKRTEVCRVEQELPTSKVAATSPIEIVSHGDSYFFSSPRSLLDLGVSVVRIGNFDYSYVSHGDLYLFSASRKSGDPSGIFYSKPSRVSSMNGDQQTVKFVEYDTGKETFNQVWKPETGNLRYMCPRITFGSGTHNPRLPEILVQGILSDLIPKDNLRRFGSSLMQTKGTIVTDGVVDEPDLSRLNNFGCPENYGYVISRGFDETNESDEILKMMPNPFKIDNHYVSLPGPPNTFHNSFCVDDYVYTYGTGRNGRNQETLYIRLSKWEQVTLTEQWSIGFSIDGLGETITSEYPYIVVVSDTDDSVVVEVIDPETQKVVSVEADLIGANP